MKPRVSRGFVACANKTAALNDMMQSIETRCREVFVVRMHLESGQRTKVIIHPFPGVAENITEALAICRKRVDGRLRGIGQVYIDATL